jgi:hypothetical protein
VLEVACRLEHPIKQMQIANQQLLGLMTNKLFKVISKIDEHRAKPTAFLNCVLLYENECKNNKDVNPSVKE